MGRTRDRRVGGRAAGDFLGLIRRLAPTTRSSGSWSSRSARREIAGRLFLSEKTIETHLSHAFGKLGVRSRAQVAAAIAAAASD
jgi:hypothetical protein